MIISFLIGAAIGAVIGTAIAEIFLYIDGIITSNRVREEAKRKEELNAVKKFLVTQIENTTTGSTIHMDGLDSSGEVVAHLTVEGGSSTSLRQNQTIYKQ